MFFSNIFAPTATSFDKDGNKRFDLKLTQDSFTIKTYTITMQMSSSTQKSITDSSNDHEPYTMVYDIEYEYKQKFFKDLTHSALYKNDNNIFSIPLDSQRNVAAVGQFLQDKDNGLSLSDQGKLRTYLYHNVEKKFEAQNTAQANNSNDASSSSSTTLSASNSRQ